MAARPQPLVLAGRLGVVRSAVPRTVSAASASVPAQLALWTEFAMMCARVLPVGAASGEGAQAPAGQRSALVASASAGLASATLEDDASLQGLSTWLRRCPSRKMQA